MGSAALRALAFGKPVVVQGEEAFSDVFGPATRDLFLRQGFYGLADGAPGASRLANQLDGLLASPERRFVLGRFGRKVVTERFSLERAVRIQLDIYERVLCLLEVKNHDPRRKRQHRARVQELCAAARRGLWPPAGRTGQLP